MKKIGLDKEKALLLFVLLIASLLRFYNAFNIPFTHDEFSAIVRSDFPDFSSLIIGGVLTDTHPAGIQVFLYYWMKLVGINELLIKLPFILMGITSVYLIWLIGSQWFNTTVALLAALLLATLEFPIMHSQIARPYISGMFLSLLMVYYWSRYLFKSKTKWNKYLIGYVITSALCAYNHHFTLLFAAIVGLSGIIFIKKDRFLYYAAAGLLIFLLYTPHLSIFSHQLQKGGVGGDDGWLGAPESDFLWQFIRYIFHYSWALMGLIVATIIVGFLIRKSAKSSRKFFLLSVFWFLIPFLIAYFYSIQVNPVLQYSVLIFSFPFLFFILFSHLPSIDVKWQLVALLVFIPILLYSLIGERKYYSLFYNSPYIGITNESSDFQNEDSGLSIINSFPHINNYYLHKSKANFDFTYYEDFEELSSFINAINDSSLNSISYGCLSISDPLIPALIYTHFPYLKHKVDYSQGNFYVFSKKESGNIPMYRPTMSKQGFENKVAFWDVKKEAIIELDSLNSQHVFEFKEGEEWGVSFENGLDSLKIRTNDFVDVFIEFKSFDEQDEVLIVSEISNENDKIDWRATSNHEFISNNVDSGYTMVHTIKLSDIQNVTKGSKLKVYVWNKGKTNVIIDNFDIKVRIGNPVLYGLLNEI